VALGDATDAAIIAILKRFQVPIISLPGYDWYRAGPRAQVEYLLEQGQRRLVYAATEKPQLQHISRIRQDVIRQVCHEHDLPEPLVVTISQTRAKACQAIAELLAVQPPPFAICAFNDEVALAALAALSDLRIAVPEAVSVIGQDNTIIGELSIPPLTTVGLETSDLVERLIASVLSVCQGGSVLDIPSSLGAKVIVRTSA
jgi:DNA-binding LacI/PurR family transcriptional regulator